MSLKGHTGIVNNPNGRKRRDYLSYYTAKDSGCWEWNGGDNSKGYGIIRWDGQKAVFAHRYFYEHHIGPIPDGMVIDHLCRNRICVNPTHLEPVTNRENVLRGISFAAQNAVKTHCLQGHPFDTVWHHADGSIGRACKTCGANKSRARRARIKAEKLQELKRQGYQLGRPRRISDKDKADMKRLRKSMSVADIAAKYKIKPPTVYLYTK